jgi:sec-independent protein translocase protein TatC
MANQPDEARPHPRDEGAGPEPSAHPESPVVPPQNAVAPSAPIASPVDPHSVPPTRESVLPTLPSESIPALPVSEPVIAPHPVPDAAPSAPVPPESTAQSPETPAPAPDSGSGHSESHPEPLAPYTEPAPDPHHDYHQEESHDYHHDDEYHQAHPDEYRDGHSHSHDHGESGGHGGGAVVPPMTDSGDPFDPDAEEGGGPVKSFLEHLEDFRWLLIKCAAAIAITMAICIFRADLLVAILSRPNSKAAELSTDTRQYISLMFGPREIMNFRSETNSITNAPGFPVGTNKYIEFELAPVQMGTNWYLAIRERTNSDKIPPGKAMPLVYTGPTGPFINSLHLAFFGGLIIAAPIVFFYIARFLMPALKPREKKYFTKALLPATILFILGVCLCYFLILPVALRAAEAYSTWMGVEMQFWKAEEYFGFVTKFMIGMGLGFEMPVILLALVKIGLLDYQKLASFRRYMILINLILGALLTTPEVLTQVAMFFPLQFLYEMTIWIAWYWEQTDRKLARRRLIMFIIGGLVMCVLAWQFYIHLWPSIWTWIKSLSAKH